MRRYFLDFDYFEMTDEEREYIDLVNRLNIKFIEKTLIKNKAVQYESDKDDIIFHPGFSDNYQITYIWKKDNKPSGHISCNTLKRAAREIYTFLPNKINYLLPTKIIN